MIGAEVIELVQLHDRQDPGDDRAGAEPHDPCGDDARDGARSTPTGVNFLSLPKTQLAYSWRQRTALGATTAVQPWRGTAIDAPLPPLPRARRALDR